MPFKRIGKILVATDESQIEKLRAFQRNAKQNGVSVNALVYTCSMVPYAADVRLPTPPWVAKISLHSYKVSAATVEHQPSVVSALAGAP